MEVVLEFAQGNVAPSCRNKQYQSSFSKSTMNCNKIFWYRYALTVYTKKIGPMFFDITHHTPIIWGAMVLHDTCGDSHKSYCFDFIWLSLWQITTENGTPFLKHPLQGLLGEMRSTITIPKFMFYLYWSEYVSAKQSLLFVFKTNNLQI